MATTLIFHNRDRDSVKRVVYDGSGRKVSEEEYSGVKNIVLEGVRARLPAGMHSSITLYVLDDYAEVTKSNAILVVRSRQDRS